MNIILKFDVTEYAIRIPDGYVTSIKMLQKGFFEWLEDQPIYCALSNQKPAMCYDADVFLRYLNEVVLLGSRERAYFITPNKKGKNPTIVF